MWDDFPPPEKTALLLRHHSRIAKRHNWRHASVAGLSVGRHIGGYAKQQSDIHLSHSYRLSAKEQMRAIVGLRTLIVPAYRTYPRFRIDVPYVQLSHQSQISAHLRNEARFYHGADHQEQANEGHTTHQSHLSVGHYLAFSGTGEFGITMQAGRAEPPHDDSYGQQNSYGYLVSFSDVQDDDVSISVQVSRSVTHYQKTLPFLSTAHRIVEKQLHLRISKRFGHIESIIPFVKFHHQIRHSDNPRQNGRRDAILFGLSFQL